MLSLTGRKLESDSVYGKCKDFLCPPESQMREWFPTLLAGRIRAAALDPYGIISERAKDNFGSENNAISYICQMEECHAKIILRKVQPAPDGNEYGLYGCFAHQHEMPRNKKSEIIFKNHIEAQEYYDKHLQGMFKNMGRARTEKARFKSKNPHYNYYRCRRSHLREGFGYFPCESFASIKQTFRVNGVDESDADEKPYSLSGIFYHSHERDKRFEKNELGIWSKHHDDPDLDKQKRKKDIRIKNGQVFPIWARKAGITVEDVLAARSTGRGEGKRSKKQYVGMDRKNKIICTHNIDIEKLLQEKKKKI